MEWMIVDGLRTLKFDLTLTLALAALVLFIGFQLQSRIGFLRRASIPVPMVGGLLFACLVYALRETGEVGLAFDASLRAPLQIAFFTTIGFGATLSLLRAGGWHMALLLLLASLAAVVQNFAGIAIAVGLGAPPALGVICGALTLTGGPATGLAFTPFFEELGIPGAGALIIASATFGILTASLVGNPIATLIIRTFKLAAPSPHNSATHPRDTVTEETPYVENPSATENPEANSTPNTEEGLTSKTLLHSLLVLFLVMGVGAFVGSKLNGLVIPIPFYDDFTITLPAYVGAMMVAATARNLDDRWRIFRLDARALEALGAIALALFLVLALMDLKLWQLAGLALPALVILCAQVALMIVYAVGVTFMLMGRDYEAAVTTSGHIGFGLGITPNAVANMEALTRVYRPAPRSFLVVPLVGAFFIDFTNTIIITVFVNFLR
jgi:ESS family glutamate:Na+ symporter